MRRPPASQRPAGRARARRRPPLRRPEAPLSQASAACRESRQAALLWLQMRRMLLGAGAALLIAGPTVLAFFSGGFFDRPRIVAAILAWALVAVAAVLVPDAPAVVGSGTACPGRPAAPDASGRPPRSPGRRSPAARRTTSSGSFCTWVRSSPPLRCCAARWPGAGWSRRWPWGRYWWWPTGSPSGCCRASSSWIAARRPRAGLEQPLTYWNAYGLVAAIGFVLAVRIAGDLERSRTLRGRGGGRRRGNRARRLPHVRARRARRRGGGAARPDRARARPAGRRCGWWAIVLAPTFLAALVASSIPRDQVSGGRGGGLRGRRAC